MGSKTIEVDLYNRDAQIHASTLGNPKTKKYLTGLYSKPMPNAWFHPLVRRHLWDGRIRFMSATGSISAGLFLATRARLEKKGYKVLVHDWRQPLEFRKKPRLRGPANLKPMPHQEDAVRAMVEGSTTGGLVLNATGTGKTAIAGVFFGMLKGRACFLVDQISLLEQARESFEAILGEPIGIVGDQKMDLRRITVATIQTLSKHWKKAAFTDWFAKLQVVIVDELHEMLGKRSNKVLKAIAPKTVYGLTATLDLDNELVAFKSYQLCGPVLFRYPFAQAVADGVLTPGVVVQARLTPSEAKAKLLSGKDEYTTFTVNSKTFNKFLEKLARTAVDSGRSVLLLVERVKHLEKLSRRMKDVPHGLFYGKVKGAARRKAKDDFIKGRTKLLIANKVLKKGVDIPPIDCVIDGACLANGNDCLQKLGRATRKVEGKKQFYYFDIGFLPADDVAVKDQPGVVRATKKRNRIFRREGIWTATLDNPSAKEMLSKAKALFREFSQ